MCDIWTQPKIFWQLTLKRFLHFWFKNKSGFTGSWPPNHHQYHFIWKTLYVKFIKKENIRILFARARICLRCSNRRKLHNTFKSSHFINMQRARWEQEISPRRQYDEITEDIFVLVPYFITITFYRRVNSESVSHG